MTKSFILFIIIKLTIFSQYIISDESISSKTESLLGLGNSVNLHSDTFQLNGNPIFINDSMPLIELTTTEENNITIGKNNKVSLYIVIPKLSTSVCEQQIKDLNNISLPLIPNDINIYVISRDTPSEQLVYKKNNDINENIIFLSDTNQEFGLATGTEIENLGLLTRTLLVTNTDNKIVHIQRPDDLTSTPDMDKAIDSIKAQIEKQSIEE